MHSLSFQNWTGQFCASVTKPTETKTSSALRPGRALSVSPYPELSGVNGSLSVEAPCQICQSCDTNRRVIGESEFCGITAPPITLRTARQAASLEANVNFEWIGITKSKWQQHQFHLGSKNARQKFSLVLLLATCRLCRINFNMFEHKLVLMQLTQTPLACFSLHEIRSPGPLLESFSFMGLIFRK